MPLTLTSRDKAYVRAVAHGGAHDMYIGFASTLQGSVNSGKFYAGTPHDRYVMLHLGLKPKSQINAAWHVLPGNSHELQDIDHTLSSDYRGSHNLGLFGFPKATDVNSSTKNHQYRYGDNVFLESTTLKIRVCMPHNRFNLDEHTLGRFIVFRSKEKQSHIPEDSMDHANPQYDLFLSADGYQMGLNGFIDHFDAENYVNYTGHGSLHALALQNMLINKSKYVVMKDCKFNLGKDFGALAFETTLRWDWNDRCNDIPFNRHDVTAGQSGDSPNKNYEWYILAIGANPSASTATQLLNVEVMGTTHAKTTD